MGSELESEVAEGGIADERGGASVWVGGPTV